MISYIKKIKRQDVINNFIFMLLLANVNIYAQVGIGTTSPFSGSILDVESTDKGLLIPRVNIEDLNTIAPVVGGGEESLLVYNTNVTTGKGFYYWNGSIWVTFSVTTYLFNNGLTETSGTVKLGGTLIENTEIDLDTYNLKVKGQNNTMLTMHSDIEYTHFGQGSINNPIDYLPSTTFNNSTFTDFIGTNPTNHPTFNIDVVLGYKGTQVGGSAIKMGSIEHMIDGSGSIFVHGITEFSPYYDQYGTPNLGSATSFQNFSGDTGTKEWGTVYATNYVTVSDKRTKDNIIPLKYGLKEVLDLNPVSFDYKKELKISKKYNKPKKLHKQKIGFIAQDMLKIIPEAVKSHDWRLMSEETNERKFLENDIYGVMYSDLVPVLVKAIQEQNKDIELLKSKVNNLNLMIKRTD